MDEPPGPRPQGTTGGQASRRVSDGQPRASGATKERARERGPLKKIIPVNRLILPLYTCVLGNSVFCSCGRNFCRSALELAAHVPWTNTQLLNHRNFDPSFFHATGPIRKKTRKMKYRPFSVQLFCGSVHRRGARHAPQSRSDPELKIGALGSTPISPPFGRHGPETESHFSK